MKNGDLVKILGENTPYESSVGESSIGVIISSYEMLIESKASATMYRVHVNGETLEFFQEDLVVIKER